MATGPNGEEPRSFNPRTFQYQAFISYSRKDTEIVDQFHSRLARFRTPSSLVRNPGTFGVPPRSLSIFLDRKSAAMGTTIPELIQSTIANSAFLIVFCSPASRNSSWVKQEIERFLADASPNRLLPVFLRSDKRVPIEDYLPEPIANLGSRAPIGGDMSQDGGVGPITHKLLGAMLGFAQDRVAREQELADRRRRLIERSALSAIAALAAGVGLFGWYSYFNAQKAEKSFRLALSALDTTTPLLGKLVSSGKITLNDVEENARTIGNVFDSLNDNELDSISGALRRKFGDALTSFAAFDGARGDAGRRARTARRSFGLAQRYKGETGSEAKRVYCDTAFEAALALDAVGQTREAIDDIRACEGAAAKELELQTKNPLARTQLLDLAVSARINEAKLQGSQSHFSEALKTFDVARGDAMLGALDRENIGASISDYRSIRGDFLTERAVVLESMGRYADAASAYAEAKQFFDDAGSNEFQSLPAVLGIARAEGRIGDRHPQALARLDKLADLLTKATDRDRSQRALLATLCEIEILRANILGETPVNESTAAGDNSAVMAVQAYGRAEKLNQELLDFDAGNRIWREMAAARNVSIGNFLFRQFEANQAVGTRSRICRENCLAVAQQLLNDAVRAYVDLGADEPHMLYNQADARIRLARALRSAGLPGATEQLDEAEKILTELHARTPEDRGLTALDGALADERADFLLEHRQYAEALDVWTRVRELQERLIAQEPEWTTMWRDRQWTLLKVAVARVKMGDAAGIRVAFSDACASADSLASIQSTLVQRDIATIRKSAALAGVPCPSK